MSETGKVEKYFGIVFSFLSGERLLRQYNNGGGIVFLRSLLVSIELFAITILFKSWLDAVPGSSFSMEAARSEISENFEWLGAIFAGTYAVFYSRFSSQWAYLANLYNQIMSVKCGLEANGLSSNSSLIKWQVGFIEDAHTLHLDRKEIFKSVIVSMLRDKKIRDEFNSTLGDDAQEIMTRVGFTEETP